MADDLTQDEIVALTDDEDEEPEEVVDVRAQFLDWVVEHFSVVEVVGSKERVRWCTRWYDHPEAVARLYALWTARVQADQDTNDLSAVSSWWINHWDRHAAILFNPQAGPFRFCDRTRGHLADSKEHGPAVPLTIPPAEWDLPA